MYLSAKTAIASVASTLTVALTVIFLVNPPKLPDANDMTRGKLALNANIRQYPPYLLHFCSGGSCRTMQEPTMANAKLNIMKYVRVLRKYVLPPVARRTRISCER